MAKVHFITQGCSANHADSEIMEGILSDKGHEIVDDENSADIIVYNTCTVKGKTETYFRKKLKELERKKKVIIAGCIPQAEKNKEQFKEHSIIGTFQIDKIDYAVNETMEGNLVTLLKRENKSRLNLPKTRKNSIIEIVPINDGCLGSCTFCKTKQARGNLFSYPENDIIRHISKAIEDGAKEIWLTSQDTAAYGKDKGSSIIELLGKITGIERDFMLRVGMGNPDFLKDCAEKYASAIKHNRVFKFVHIPVQAGSDKVLRDMRREYTVNDFKKIVMKLREEIPSITISTDIICGFPTETEDDFRETLKLVDDIRLDVINISRYFPRPGTAAALMAQLDGNILKNRTGRLTELFRRIALENNRKWLGWEGNVLIDEVGKNSTSIGRNYAYKQVVVDGVLEIGLEMKVRITGCTPFCLKGKAI
ncbi:tRNA (N(6)-L-threonylcarbamoyladenosine(37)-C(2))-methylthiotransferase [Candidatus Woesearchaeota archaeon]|nr:tRNA (N(6)-L-threonylcarbamoyladenosine(37)-C(2))-methylthiotransferase [Candidatus Woesearchaeota archaeon]